MAVAAAGILPTALLEDDDLAAATVLDDLADHGGVGDERHADRRLVAAEHDDLAEGHLVADLAVELGDLQCFVGDNAILLAARFDDCEHLILAFEILPRAA